VKVNEVFVHLDHIEEVIGTLHVIREATATVIRHPSGLDMVQVCYVLEEACSNPELVMREHLKKHDCSTGVAFEFRCSNRLSLLESGKLNRVDINFSGADSVISQTFDSPEELSNSVRALWISTLCLSVVGDDDNFFTLGGTSLDLVRLLSMIETRFGKRPSLALLYRDPTFSNLLKIVAGEVTPLDLRREMDQAQLDIQRLRGANKKRLVLSPVKRILITGSTGYFGRCLVQEAVRTNPAARIFCAVRGKTLDLAEQRFEELFRSAYQSVDQRSLRLLYLENWNCLSDCDEEFDQIIHGAADKNVFATIADLWGSNVHPLVPLLGRLARGGILQFCSTFPSLMQSGDGVRTFSSRRSSTGYEESKMLAEELLQVSAARNIVTAPTEASQRPALPSTAQSQGCDERDPINAIVYRLPLLLPDLRWPIWNRSDFLARVIAASVAIQKCPVIVTDVDIPWMPARLAARTMLESDGVGRAGVAELPLNVKWTSWNQMMAVLAELSGLALCDWDRWIDALSSDAALQSQARVLEALSKVYLLSVDGQGRQKHSDAQSLGDSLSSGYHWILQTDSGGPND
jgi:acyl carrier protein